MLKTVGLVVVVVVVGEIPAHKKEGRKDLKSAGMGAVRLRWRSASKSVPRYLYTFGKGPRRVYGTQLLLDEARTFPRLV